MNIELDPVSFRKRKFLLILAVVATVAMFAFELLSGISFNPYYYFIPVSCYLFLKIGTYAFIGWVLSLGLEKGFIRIENIHPNERGDQ